MNIIENKVHSVLFFQLLNCFPLFFSQAAFPYPLSPPPPPPPPLPSPPPLYFPPDLNLQTGKRDEERGNSTLSYQGLLFLNTQFFYWKK
jgi:hypothetical protein